MAPDEQLDTEEVVVLPYSVLTEALEFARAALETIASGAKVNFTRKKMSALAEFTLAELNKLEETLEVDDELEPTAGDDSGTEPGEGPEVISDGDEPSCYQVTREE